VPADPIVLPLSFNFSGSPGPAQRQGLRYGSNRPGKTKAMPVCQTQLSLSLPRLLERAWIAGIGKRDLLPLPVAFHEIAQDFQLFQRFYYFLIGRSCPEFAVCRFENHLNGAIALDRCHRTISHSHLAAKRLVSRPGCAVNASPRSRRPWRRVQTGPIGLNARCHCVNNDSPTEMLCCFCWSSG